MCIIILACAFLCKHFINKWNGFCISQNVIDTGIMNNK